MRQQIMDQQHSMNTPSYPMMAQQQQQQQQQQQPQAQIDAGGRSFMTQDHPTQQQMYDSVRGNMPSASFGNVSHSAPYNNMRPGPPANVTITAVSTSLPSSLSTSGLSFSVAPQPTAVDGSTVTAHYGAPGQQRSPYNVQNYPTSTAAAAASLPASSQVRMYALCSDGISICIIYKTSAVCYVKPVVVEEGGGGRGLEPPPTSKEPLQK